MSAGKILLFVVILSFCQGALNNVVMFYLSLIEIKHSFITGSKVFQVYDNPEHATY